MAAGPVDRAGLRGGTHHGRLFGASEDGGSDRPATEHARELRASWPPDERRDKVFREMNRPVNNWIELHDCLSPSVQWVCGWWPMPSLAGDGPREPAYLYRAQVVDVVDGDTIDVDIDLGFYVWIKKTPTPQAVRHRRAGDPRKSNARKGESFGRVSAEIDRRQVGHHPNRERQGCSRSERTRRSLAWHDLPGRKRHQSGDDR